MKTVKELKDALKEAGVTAPANATKHELEAIVALIQEPEVVIDVEVEHPIVSTEVDLTQPDEIHLDTPAEALPSADRWQQMERISERIAASSLIIPALRNRPDDILLVLLAAHDLGIPATQALSKLHIVDGKLSMAAEMMVALVLRDGHELWGDEANDAQTATCYGRRKNSTEVTKVAYSMTDAKLAGLEQRSTWKKYPKSMLWARSVSMLCRQAFPDSVAGVSYTPDELEVAVTHDPNPTPVDVVAIKQPQSSEEAQELANGKVYLTETIQELKKTSLATYDRLKEFWKARNIPPLKEIDTLPDLTRATDLLDEVISEQPF